MTHDPPRPLKLDDLWGAPPHPLAPLRAGEAEEQVFSPSGPIYLRDVIDRPARSLSVEYKSWRNVRHPEDQAEIARDIAAIANMGGGAIAFGFDEERLTPAELHPVRTVLDQPGLAAILAPFLDPVPPCEVRMLRSVSGEEHLVIRIGGHGASPVFTRTCGLPLGALSMIEGGALYVRRHASPRKGQITPRIESATISAPGEWLPLLRRCLRAERQSLLGAIEAAIEGRGAPRGNAERLLAFHDAARARFVALARNREAYDLAGRHYVLSYALELDRPETLEPVQMPELLSRTIHSLRRHVQSARPLFDPPYARAVRPRFIVDPALGDDETDILETAWLAAPSGVEERAEHWRVSPRGLGSIVRAYAEDDAGLNARVRLQPGTWLSPALLARELAELVVHVRTWAGLFGSASAVLFHCEWRGLSGRRLHDPGARWAARERSQIDRRGMSLRVPLASLTRAWPETVAQLMAPLLRVIEPDLALGADWVEAQLRNGGGHVKEGVDNC